MRKIVFESQGVLNDWISAINQRCYEIMFDLDMGRDTGIQQSLDMTESWRNPTSSTFHRPEQARMNETDDPRSSVHPARRMSIRMSSTSPFAMRK